MKQPKKIPRRYKGTLMAIGIDPKQWAIAEATDTHLVLVKKTNKDVRRCVEK